MCRKYRNIRSYEQWIHDMRVPSGNIGACLNQWSTGVFTPEQNIPVVFNSEGVLHPKLAHWGVKLGEIVCYHARGEKLLKEPWSSSVASGRVVIPSDGWREGNGVFTPEGITNFAGLLRGNSVVLLTQPATDKVQKYHNRQPVILDRLESMYWLSRNSEIEDVVALSKTNHDQNLNVNYRPI